VGGEGTKRVLVLDAVAGETVDVLVQYDRYIQVDTYDKYIQVDRYSRFFADTLDPAGK
jgi:hypothetical protein